MHQERKSAAKSDKVLGLFQLIGKLFFPHLLFSEWKKNTLGGGGLCPLNFLRLYWLMMSLPHTLGITFFWRMM